MMRLWPGIRIVRCDLHSSVVCGPVGIGWFRRSEEYHERGGLSVRIGNLLDFHGGRLRLCRLRIVPFWSD